MKSSPQAVSPRQQGQFVDVFATEKREEHTEPASHMQQALWALDQLAAGGSALNLHATLCITGRLDIDVLKESLNEIARRHEILRTTFLYHERGRRSGRLLQIVAPQSPAVKLHVLDLRQMAASDREAELKSLAAEAVRRSFDLTRLPLFWVRLLAVSNEDHVLQLVAHRIILDGSAIGVFISELAALYQAFLNRESSSLPPPRQYSEFAGWELRSISTEALERELSYWTDKLAGTLPVLELPSDRPRSAECSFRGSREGVVLPAALSKGLRCLSEREGTTLSVLMLAAFNALLHRYTGVEDLLTGCTVNNRRIPKHEALIGPVDNILVVRTDLSGDPTFLDLLSRVQKVIEAAYAHRDVPCDRVRCALQPGLSSMAPPPFQVMFDLDRCPTGAFHAAGLSSSSAEIESESNSCDLRLSLIERGQEVTVNVRYNAALFEPATVARMLGHFQILLNSVVGDPRLRLSALPLLSEAEGHRLLVEWNDTAADYPRDKCIHQLFEAQAERTPDALAVVYGDRHFTYRELNVRSNRLAHLLVKHGVGRDTLVGILVDRSLEMLVTILAILKAGGAYVPLDPAHPAERLAFMAEDSGMALVVAEKRFAGKLRTHRAEILDIDRTLDEASREPDQNLSSRCNPENLAYVIYTSGSTGKPKGVLTPHRAVVNLLTSLSSSPGASDQDVFLAVTTLSFDVAAADLYLPLMVGARIVLASRQVASDGAQLARALGESGATVMQATPATWRMLIESGWQGSNKLRIFTAGEALTETLAGQLLNRCAELWNLYGPTETTVYSTGGQVRRRDRPITIGRPIANTQVYVLDSRMQPVPIGVPGELHIGGDGVARGYLNLPELTAQKFVVSPFAAKPGARMYKSGDLVRYLPDGHIEFLGRIDHQVKIRGYRIELGEVEAVLASHSAVRQAVVVAREDTPGRKRLVAYVVPHAPPGPPVSEIRQYLNEKLPDYMVPSAFVNLPTLPLTPSGKVDRHALPAPEQHRPEMISTFVAPRDAVELQLAKIWEDVLGIRPIGIRDNYFDLGADSLQAARLFARASKKFGKSLSPSSLFQAPTLELQARQIRQQEDSRQWTCLVPIQLAGSQPPLFCVHGGAGTILFLRDLARHLGQDQPLYGLQAQGLYDATPPHTTVEQMAAHYVNEIRTVEPEGPYCLVGYCFGAVVTFEMAHQLEQQGQNVALLASINGPCPAYSNGPGGRDAWAPNVRASFSISSFRQALRQVSPQAKLEYAFRTVAESARSAAVYYLWYASRLHGAYWRAVSWLMRYYRSRRRYRPLPPPVRDKFFLHNSHWAEREYKPKAYPGRMIIFRAKGLYPEPELGWDGLVTGGIETHEIPGLHRDHRNIVEEPAVRELARQMRDCLVAR